MNEAIELHDSKLAAIDWQGARCVIRCQPAYVHRSVGVPGQDSGEGGWRDFQWEIDEATTTGDVSQPAWVMDGRLECGDVIYENVVPLPLVSRDRIVLSLTTNSGENWAVRGTGIRIAPLNDGRYCEIFPWIRPRLTHPTSSSKVRLSAILRTFRPADCRLAITMPNLLSLPLLLLATTSRP